MNSHIEEIEFPDALVRKTIASSLVHVGIYNGHKHQFIAGGFHPDQSVFNFISKEVEAYGFAPDDAPAIVRNILSDVGLEQKHELVGTLDLAGKNALPDLTRVCFEEDAGGEGEHGGVTDLIYLGNSRFYVLSTSRSTILPGCVIKAREIPLSLGRVWSFDIFDNSKSKSPRRPIEAAEMDDAWFTTRRVAKVSIVHSPEFFLVIDQEKDFGGEMQPLSEPEEAFFGVLGVVRQEVNQLGDMVLPNNEPFPNYLNLLTYSKQSGVPSFVLNSLIETVETRIPVPEPKFVEQDWVFYDSETTKERKRKEQEKRDKKRYVQLEAALEEELKKVQRRRVALLFDAAGVISEQSRKHLDSIKVEMDELARRGFGTVGYADSKISTALANTQPRPRHNLKVSLILSAVLVGLIFVCYSWITARNSIKSFDSKMEVVASLVEQDSFNEAKENCELAKAAFKPSYLRFLVSRKTRQTLNGIEDSIDNFVADRIEQVNVLIKANRGRIDPYTWDLIVQAMEFRPQNPELVELRERYINQ